MPILVTGGSGFVGRHICRALAERGEEFIAIDVSPPKDQLPGGERARFLRCDLGDFRDLLWIIEKNHIDRVISAAAVVGEAAALRNPSATFRTNVEGVFNLLEVARLLDLKRIIFFSTAGVYRFRQALERITEDEHPQPYTVYAATKQIGEILGQKYHEKYGVDCAFLRPTFIYGQGEGFGTILSILLRAAVEGRPFRARTGSDHIIDYVHVGDVAEGAVQVSKAERLNHRIYNLGGGRPKKLSEVIGIIRSKIPAADLHLGPGLLDDDTFPSIPKEEVLPLHANRDYNIDITRAREDFGYEPKRTLEEGISEYLGWLGQSREGSS